MNAIEMKCRREALGLSRDALADTLDVREQNITRWEFGKNPCLLYTSDAADE